VDDLVERPPVRPEQRRERPVAGAAEVQEVLGAPAAARALTTSSAAVDDLWLWLNNAANKA
jgi:hypothetical protein